MFRYNRIYVLQYSGGVIVELVLFSALLIVGMWYAFRSGMLHERERRSQQPD